MTLAFLGNSLVVIAAYGFYFLEKGHNPKVNEYMDALWFCFSTFTTVGYGDIFPVTFWGRVMGIGMMLVGTVIFVTFTALFANVIMASKIIRIEDKLKNEDERIDELIKYYKNSKLGGK